MLHGSPGIGKSKLLGPIAGITSPNSGTIRVDRAATANVTQETTLLHDRTGANLLRGLSAKSDEYLIEGLRVAGSNEFVVPKPNGIEAQGATTRLFCPGTAEATA